MAWPCACPPNVCGGSADESYHSAYSSEGNSYYSAASDTSQFEERGRPFAASSFVTPDRPPPPFVVPESTIFHGDIGDLSGSMTGSWPSCCMEESGGTDASFNAIYESLQAEPPGGETWFNPIYESPPEDSFGADDMFNQVYESTKEEPAAYRPRPYDTRGTPPARPRCIQMTRRRFDTISEEMSPPEYSTPTDYRSPPSPPTPDFPSRPPVVSPSTFHGDGTPVRMQPQGGLNFSPPRPRRRLDFSSSEKRCPNDYTTPADYRSPSSPPSPDFPSRPPVVSPSTFHGDGTPVRMQPQGGLNFSPPRPRRRLDFSSSDGRCPADYSTPAEYRSYPTPTRIHPSRQPVVSPSRFQGDGTQVALQSHGGLNLSPPRPQRRFDFSSASYGYPEDGSDSGDISIDINLIPD